MLYIAYDSYINVGCNFMLHYIFIYIYIYTYLSIYAAIAACCMQMYSSIYMCIYICICYRYLLILVSKFNLYIPIYIHIRICYMLCMLHSGMCNAQVLTKGMPGLGYVGFRPQLVFGPAPWKVLSGGHCACCRQLGPFLTLVIKNFKGTVATICHPLQ